MSLRNFHYKWVVIEQDDRTGYGKTYNARGHTPTAAVEWVRRATPSTAKRFLVVPNDDAQRVTLKMTPTWTVEKA